MPRKKLVRPVDTSVTDEVAVENAPEETMEAPEDVEEPQDEDTLSHDDKMEAFADRIAQGVTRGITNTQRPKVRMGQYDPKSVFQPDKRKMLKLTRDSFQNGFKLEEPRLFNTEIALLNRITRPGRYLDRTVEVVVRDEGRGSTSLDIRYPNKTIDQRMEQRGRWRTFTELLQLIVDEQDREVALDEQYGRARAAR